MAGVPRESGRTGDPPELHDLRRDGWLNPDVSASAAQPFHSGSPRPSTMGCLEHSIELAVSAPTTLDPSPLTLPPSPPPTSPAPSQRSASNGRAKDAAWSATATPASGVSSANTSRNSVWRRCDAKRKVSAVSAVARMNCLSSCVRRTVAPNCPGRGGMDQKRMRCATAPATSPLQAVWSSFFDERGRRTATHPPDALEVGVRNVEVERGLWAEGHGGREWSVSWSQLEE